MRVIQYIAAIDQGTTSSRCMIFDHDGAVVSVAQKEHEQFFPRAGWVEHDPQQLWINTREVVASALAKADLTKRDIAAIGITNQRETAVVWDRNTGEPVYNAIVWQDTRTDELCTQLGGDEGPGRYQKRTGLPLSTYFSGPKVRWILDNVDGARERAEAGELCFGTIDSWILWHITEGTHVTDVTNASRTLLMNLETLDWDPEICADFGIPMSMLPEIRSSSEIYGVGRERGTLPGVPVAGILGDQQAATFGQACLSEGEAKNTYGTGNFLLLNTGTTPVHSKHGLLTTVCYKIGDAPAVYALEGPWPSPVRWCSGCATTWESSVRPRTSRIWRSPSTTTAAPTSCPRSPGCSPPAWRPDARGAIVGLTRFVNKATSPGPPSRPPRIRPVR